MDLLTVGVIYILAYFIYEFIILSGILFALFLVLFIMSITICLISKNKEM